jgi:branched-subunit amino acid transport protein
MQTIYMIAGMVLVTFGIRYILLPLSGYITFTPTVVRGLGYVPPAVLTAIITPAVLIPDGRSYAVTWTNPYLIGALCTVLIGWMSKNLLITIVGGMIVFVIWQYIIGTGLLA